jgi:hypothetical protein
LARRLSLGGGAASGALAMADDNKDAGSWWKTLPGVLTGIGSTVAAFAALVVALSQAGLLGEKKVADAKAGQSQAPGVPEATPAEPAPPQTVAPSVARAEDKPRTLQPKPMPRVSPTTTPAEDKPRSAPPPAARTPAPDAELPTAPTAAGRSLFSRLAQANIRNSVGDATMKNWLADNTGGYRQLAEASLALLAGRSLAGQGVDLDVVSYAYVKSLGIAGDDLPAQHQIRTTLLRSALLKAHANKNGSEARSLDEILR